MASAGDDALREFVKHHHVHFSVEPEWVITAKERWPVGFNLRLFAGHEKHARALPAGPKSRALAASLRTFVESVLPDCAAVARVDLEPFRPALYESSEVPGTDEVAPTLHLLREFDGGAHRLEGGEERCLKEIRRRLKRLAAPER